MKKLLFIPVFLIVSTLCAQETFVVPSLECAHKHQFMTYQANAMIMASINYAKTSGKTIQDVAAFTGELFAKTWDKNWGFSGLVKGMLHNFVCITPDGVVEILAQSGEMVKIRTNGLFPYLKNNGALFDVSYDEYLLYCKIMIEKICEAMGADFSMEANPDTIIWTISKK